MRTSTIAIAAALIFSPLALAKSSSVNGYIKKDGTYVAPHQRTSPNGTKADNYSTKGNTNPYTGKDGTVDPLKPKPPKP